MSESPVSNRLRTEFDFGSVSKKFKYILKIDDYLLVERKVCTFTFRIASRNFASSGG
jgi:hypothetical protein